MTTKPEVKLPEFPALPEKGANTWWSVAQGKAVGDAYKADQMQAYAMQYGTLCYEAGLAAVRVQAGQSRMEFQETLEQFEHFLFFRIPTNSPYFLELDEIYQSLKQSLALPADTPQLLHLIERLQKLVQTLAEGGSLGSTAARHYWGDLAALKQSITQPAQAAAPDSGEG